MSYLFICQFFDWEDNLVKVIWEKSKQNNRTEFLGSDKDKNWRID